MFMHKLIVLIIMAVIHLKGDRINRSSKQVYIVGLLWFGKLSPQNVIKTTSMFINNETSINLIKKITIMCHFHD